MILILFWKKTAFIQANIFLFAKNLQDKKMLKCDSAKFDAQKCKYGLFGISKQSNIKRGA